MSRLQTALPEVMVPVDTDYIGIYLTNRCFLTCPYCITNQNQPFINLKLFRELEAGEWVEALNRLCLPPGLPLSFQGGEPFLHKGIWEILEQVRHKVDILTALPPQVTPEALRRLKTLQWNRRESPYPTIRVSYHHGQNDYKKLVERIRDLQEIVSIGLFHIEHPGYPEMTEQIRDYARRHGVEFRTKAFLGEWQGRVYARYKYPDACAGRPLRPRVLCRNTVLPVGPDGQIYRCHSDLYARRAEGVIGQVLDPDLRLDHRHRVCAFYGACSPCDVKIKTNHLQQDGYTSVDILFDEPRAA